MPDVKEIIKQIQLITYGAYGASGQVAALLGEPDSDPKAVAKALENTAARLERGAVELRAICERSMPPVSTIGQKPTFPSLDIAGQVEANEFGWLHIQLNTLLPHCRYQTSDWLSDTIRRLLDEYESGGSELPFFKEAMLVIDEHCAVKGRHIFDQDNKGYKAVSNAIKGRLIPDDDQHTLALALLSTKSELDVCHITLLDMVDVADFFAYRSGDYAVPDFYGGSWGC